MVLDNRNIGNFRWHKKHLMEKAPDAIFKNSYATKNGGDQRVILNA